MRRTMRHYRVIGLIALLGVLMTACTQAEPTPITTPSPTPTLAPPSPQIILETSSVTMELEDSYHFEMDVDVKFSQGGISMDIPVTSVGDFQAPDRSQATTSMTFLGINIEFKVITIGDTTYQTNPQTGQWEIGSDSATPFGSPDAFTGEGSSDIDDLVFVAEETLSGTRVYHLKGLAPPETFGEEGGELEVEIWIGVKDHLIRQIAAEGEISLESNGDPFFNGGPAGSATGTVTIRFFDFGKPVNIEAPEITALSSSF